MNHLSTLCPSPIKRHIIQQKLCSCCNESGHNIKKCNDLRIATFIKNTYYMTYNASEKMYLDYLHTIDNNLLNALCIKLKLAPTMYELKDKNSAINYLLKYFIKEKQIVRPII